MTHGSSISTIQTPLGLVLCLLPTFQKPCPSSAKQGAGDGARLEEGRGGFTNAASHRELATENCADGWACKECCLREQSRTWLYRLLLAWELCLLDTHEPSQCAGAVASTSYSSQNTSKADGGKVSRFFVVHIMLCGRCSVFHDLEMKQNVSKA